jgi:hypothetical protein
MTAFFVVLGQGGPPLAMLTCLGTVIVATVVGELVGSGVNRFLGLGRAYIAKREQPPGSLRPPDD